MTDNSREGWIEWAGGENPVGDAVVIRRYRDGIVGEAMTTQASGRPWKHYGDAADIIAYRVVTDAPVSPAGYEAPLGVVSPKSPDELAMVIERDEFAVRFDHHVQWIKDAGRIGGPGWEEGKCPLIVSSLLHLAQDLMFRLASQEETIRAAAEALKPFADLADRFTGPMVEVCNPHPDNPSRNIQPFATIHLERAFQTAARLSARQEGK